MPSERSRRGQIKNIAVPLYANVQQCARIAKAQADARALASAVSIYGAHMGVVATALTDLTSQVTNSQTCQSRQCMKVAAVRDARGCPFAACIRSSRSGAGGE